MSAGLSADVSGHDIWVAFTGACDVRALKFLKPGFRHCFALLNTQAGWVVIDPLLHKTDVSITGLASAQDLPRALRLQGLHVVRAPRLRPPRRMCMPGPFTCVEAVKRLIGLHDWRVVTPFQLYRALMRKAVF